MLRLRKLVFGNIGRFVKKQEISFDAFGQLVQFNGSNKNTGGSSGAGKSTVFHALDYLLGINDIPTTGLQSRLTKEKLYAEGYFDVNGTELVVKRSKSGGLSIKFGDEEVSGNVKLAEERLEQIIGIPKTLFKKMVHKKQKEGGFFLNLTAKQSYEFLMDALGLNGLNNKTIKIDAEIKEIINRITQLGHAIDALTNSIDEFEELLEFHKEPTCDIKPEEIEENQKIIDKWKKELADMEAKLNSEIAALDKPGKPEVTVEANPEIANLEQKLAEIEHAKKDKIFQYNKQVTNAQEARSAVESKLKEIPFHKEKMNSLIEDMKKQMEEKKHLEENKCPTCSQKWTGDEVFHKINVITSNIEKLKNQILEKKALVDEEPELSTKLERVKEIQVKIESEHNLDDLNNQIDATKQKITELKSEDKNKASVIENKYLNELNEYNTKVNEVKQKYEQSIKEKNALISDTSQVLAVKQNTLNNFKAAKAEYQEKKDKLESTIKQKKTDLKDAEKQRKDKKYELSVREESKRVLKTYTLQIFQDTLDYIGSYATEILSNIPNMSNSTIYFEGCKENKSGTIKDEVNAIINMDGYNDINIKTLSGGERTAIDLAVDLAVIDMVESKAGKGADFFILDEPFEGLEEINISQCLEVLSQADTNKKIIIVDHNPIAKEMINDSVVVERDGEESVVL